MWIRDLQEAAARLSAGEKVDFDALKINLFGDRIFVYTPRGDIFDLPSGALPLDFAYQVHSELAAKASGFRINGKIAKFDTELKSGDVIEVLTRRNILPNLGWLRKITTPHARNKLRSQLRRENIDVAVKPAAPQAKKMPWQRSRVKPKPTNKADTKKN